MPSFEVAHIHQQGQDMIIFPLDERFGRQSGDDQSRTLEALQFRAHAAGLRGAAVAVWEDSNGGHFRGPRQWRAFLESIDLGWVLANVNRTLSWDG